MVGPGGLLSLEQALLLSREEVRDLSSRYLNPGLAQILGLLDFDRRYVRAQGMRVWDRHGEEYLDFLGAYGAINLGHNPAPVLAALDRVRGIPNLLQASLGALPAALAHNLAQLLPGDLSRSFFVSSGTEAVEGALKLARAASGRTRLLYCQGSFHGKTLGSLSVTGRPKYQEPFKPLLPDTDAVPYGDLEALENALRPRNVAAFIVEPIQGEGGIIVPPEGYLRGVRELCDRYGTLLIVDEIQTGLGRTGRFLASEHEGVQPDILCLAKSLGGGVMPLGAFVTTPAIWDRAYGGPDRALLHTSTFGGNAFAAAAGLAALDAIVRQDLPSRAAQMGDYLLAGLRDLAARHRLVREVRGRGLMVGIEFAPPTRGIVATLTGGRLNRLAEEYTGAMVAGELLKSHRIITAYTLNNPNVIRLEPPLIVGREEIDIVLNALDDVFTRRQNFFRLALGSARTVLGRRKDRED